MSVSSPAGKPVPDARIRFSSSDPRVVSVTSQGVRTAHRAGTAYVAVRSDRGYDVMTVTVQRVLAHLEVWTVPQILVGSSELLGVQAFDLHGFPMDAAVTVHSSDDRVASLRKVDVDWPNAHELVGIAEGDAVITAASGSVTAQATLKVAR